MLCVSHGPGPLLSSYVRSLSPPGVRRISLVVEKRWSVVGGMPQQLSFYRPYSSCAKAKVSHSSKKRKFSTTARAEVKTSIFLFFQETITGFKNPPHGGASKLGGRREMCACGGSVGAEGCTPKEQPQMSPRNWPAHQRAAADTVALVGKQRCTVARTCAECFRTRLRPDDERPAVNLAINHTMCSGLLQANVILTLVPQFDVGLRRYTRSTHTHTGAHCLQSMRWRQSLSTLATKRHRDEAKRGLTGLFFF